MAYQWHSYENAAAASAALADAAEAALQHALNKKGSAVLAVSGGRSPIAFFEALSQKNLDWQNIGITLVDERIVPTTHADSNTGLVRRHLLQNQAAAAQWIPVVEAGTTENRFAARNRGSDGLAALSAARCAGVGHGRRRPYRIAVPPSSAAR